MSRLIDTSVLIDLERTGKPLGLIGADEPNEAFAPASITVAELLVGAEKADSPLRRRRRFDVVETILARFPVLPYDLDVARAHAHLWAELEHAGQRIGPYDLLVAATALVHGYAVLTFNVREFARVPGLVVHRPGW
jgi:predicted nucleic acid-binding protein